MTPCRNDMNRTNNSVIHINLLLGAGQLVPKKYCRIKVAMKLFMSKNFFTVKIKSSWGGEKNE